jgi:hypothetical protein
MLRQWKQWPLGAGQRSVLLPETVQARDETAAVSKYDDNLAVLPEQEFSANPDDPTACNFHPHNLEFHPLI